ncbi:MAG: prolyl aminopeptidase [Alphaproteobacteria bacterium]|nr:MAG: prolyl aminopeptidase [Alphaproteobacteria bacterium]
MDQTRPSRRTALYPPAEPTAKGMLTLDSRHRMYWEVSGNPEGIPVVFLHGGPGAGCHPHHRRYFDPRRYRVILFDQRGAGRSEPMGELTDNTTAHLVDDLERLRGHLGVENWLLFGGSWGSALALAYGEAHAERCLGFILRGIFLGRASEVDWFLNGMGTFFPEARRRFVEFLPANERGDLLGAYHRRLTDDDPEVHMPAARVWAAYEGACSTLRHDSKADAGENGGAGGGGSGKGAFTLARIEAHYFINDMFMEEDALIENIGRLEGVPAVIVQGRYDMVCPIKGADALVRAWPGRPGENGLEYHVIADAGHAASEPGTRAALMAATEKFKSLGD